MEERMKLFKEAREAFYELVEYHDRQSDTFSDIQTKALKELRVMWSIAHPLMGVEYFYWMKKLHEKINDRHMTGEAIWIDYLAKSLIFRMSYGSLSNCRIEIINHRPYEVTSDIGLYEVGDRFDRNNLDLWKAPNFKYPFSLEGLAKSPFV